MKHPRIPQASSRVRTGVALIGALFATTHALAHAPGPDGAKEPLARGLTEAHAVIHGTVSDVRYRLSEKNDQGEQLPHTFVTYKVRSVLAGQIASESLTLRFLGGPDGRGRFFAASEIPMFNAGHEDVLLVRGNGDAACPLVDCGHGRFRIHQERVYNARSLPVAGIKGGRVLTGKQPETALLRYAFPVPAFEALLENESVRRLAIEQSGGNLAALKQRYEATVPRALEYAHVPIKRERNTDFGSGGTAVEIANPRDEQPMFVGEFLRTLAQHPALQNSSHRRLVQSVDPDRRFAVKLPTPGAPAASRLVTRPPAETEPDRREREQFEAGNGDPTLSGRR